MDGQEMAWTVWQGKGQGYLRFHSMHKHEEWIAEHRPRLVLAVMDKVHYSLVTEKTARMGDTARKMCDWGLGVARNLAAVVVDEVHVCSGMLGANAHWFVCGRACVPARRVLSWRARVFGVRA